MGKALRCKLGFHKWYVHNSYCHWFLFNADETCLLCGKHVIEALQNMSLNTIGNIEYSQSLTYGPFSTVESATEWVKAKRKPYLMAAIQEMEGK